MTEVSSEVTQADTVRFLESAFRNIELPPLSPRDVDDITDGLRSFARHRIASSRQDKVREADLLRSASNAILTLHQFRSVAVGAAGSDRQAVAATERAFNSAYNTRKNVVEALERGAAASGEENPSHSIALQRLVEWADAQFIKSGQGGASLFLRAELAALSDSSTREESGAGDDWTAMKTAETSIMQEYRWGNLTKLGVANHLRRAGFDLRYATDKANSLSTNAGDALREAAEAVATEARNMTMTMRRRKIFDRLAAALSPEGGE